MRGQRSFLACYDIADAKRLRKIERIMSGYGYRLQESVFLCHLSKLMQVRLCQEITASVNHEQDQWMLIDLGENHDVEENFTIIGKKVLKIPKIIFI